MVVQMPIVPSKRSFSLRGPEIIVQTSLFIMPVRGQPLWFSFLIRSRSSLNSLCQENTRALDSIWSSNWAVNICRISVRFILQGSSGRSQTFSKICKPSFHTKIRLFTIQSRLPWLQNNTNAPASVKRLNWTKQYAKTSI